MNTQAPFFPAKPVLKLPSRIEGGGSGAGGAVPAACPPFTEELAAFREREANLRAYEERLRAGQAQLDARMGAPLGSGSPFARSSSSSPFTGAGDAGLEAAWNKFHRAHALLEADQRHLRDERMALHETEKQLRQREDGVASREAELAERERVLVEKKPARVASARDASAVERLTTAPFRMAKSIFKAAE
ncbi:MAG TPA: hypothetical protein VG710_11740 [Opitutus sp.]|nr:hypothetical protein [Opitutus sp.]